MVLIVGLIVLICLIGGAYYFDRKSSSQNDLINSQSLPSPTTTSVPTKTACQIASENPENYIYIEGKAKPMSKINLTPSSGKLGTQVNVEGSGWPPNTKINLRWNIIDDYGGESVSLYSTLSDATGSFNNTVLIPVSKSLEKCDILVSAVLEDFKPYNNPYLSPYHASAFFINSVK